MSRKKKPIFTAEFKSEAVSSVLKQGYGIKQAANDLGISESALLSWVTKAQDLGLDPKASEPLEKELRELRREIERTRQERDILKKAIGYFATPRE